MTKGLRSVYCGAGGRGGSETSSSNHTAADWHLVAMLPPFQNAASAPLEGRDDAGPSGESSSKLQTPSDRQPVHAAAR